MPITAITQSGLILISSQVVTTAAPVAAVEFTQIGTLYDEYFLEVQNAVPVSASPFTLRASTNGGVSFAAASGNYAHTSTYVQTGSAPQANSNSTTATSIDLSAALNVGLSVAAGGWSGTIRLINPAGTVHNKMAVYSGGFLATDYTNVHGAGVHKASQAAVNAVQLRFNSGNISSGLFKLYGVSK